MSTFLSFTILGLFTGAAYAIAASGLVLTYTTTRVFNIAHGAFGMVMAFTFWDLSQRQGMPMWLSLLLVLFVIAPGTSSNSTRKGALPRSVSRIFPFTCRSN